MSNVHTPEHGIEEIDQPQPGADLAQTVEYNETAAAQADRVPNPNAHALVQQHSSMFGHDERFGHVTNTRFTTIDGRTMAIDTTRVRDAAALKEAARMQQEVDAQADDMMADAEAMVANVGENSAAIPPGEPEAAEVGALDAEYAAETSLASAEIAAINGGVGEQMDAALAQAG